MTSITSFWIFARLLSCICFDGSVDTSWIESNNDMLIYLSFFPSILDNILNSMYFGPCCSLLIARTTTGQLAPWAGCLSEQSLVLFPGLICLYLSFMDNGSALFIFLAYGLMTLPNSINVGQINKTLIAFYQL